MIIDNTKRMEVNLFMELGKIPKYALVVLDRHEFVVKVLYYSPNGDEDISIDLNKVEVVKNFICSSIEEAERKFEEINDMSIVIPMVTEYARKQIH